MLTFSKKMGLAELFAYAKAECDLQAQDGDAKTQGSELAALRSMRLRRADKMKFLWLVTRRVTAVMDAHFSELTQDQHEVFFQFHRLLRQERSALWLGQKVTARSYLLDWEESSPTTTYGLSSLVEKTFDAESEADSSQVSNRLYNL